VYLPINYLLIIITYDFIQSELPRYSMRDAVGEDTACLFRVASTRPETCAAVFHMVQRPQP
jgi:hypothetical protein